MDWAQWAVERSPADELGLRRLMAMLDRFGDRGAALKTFERFTRRLQADYGLDPSPETITLVQSLRDRKVLKSAPGAPPDDPQTNASDRGESDVPNGEPSAGRPPPTRSTEDTGPFRSRLGGVLHRVRSWLRRRTRRWTTTLDPQCVLVAVFENQTGDLDLDSIGSMAGCPFLLRAGGGQRPQLRVTAHRVRHCTLESR